MQTADTGEGCKIVTPPSGYVGLDFYFYREFMCRKRPEATDMFHNIKAFWPTEERLPSCVTVRLGC